MMLAQELMDQIIDEVKASAEAAVTLKSFSLVAHRFRAPIQRHFFRALTAGRWNIEALARNLAEAPHLASYVVDLTIDFNIGERGSLQGVPASGLDAALILLFPVLCNVERLALSSSSSWTTRSLPADLRSAFIHLLCRPSLRALLFLDIHGQPFATPQDPGIPSSLVIHALSSYKEVGLNSAFRIHHDEIFIPVPPPSSPPILETLHVYCFRADSMTSVEALIFKPQLAQQVENLQHLKLSVDATCNSIERYKYFHTLQHLELELLSVSRTRPLDLPVLPCLCRLTLRVLVYKLQIPDTVLSIMADLPARVPCLEDIAIFLSSMYKNDTALGDYIDAPPAAAADAALIALAHFRAATFHVDAPTALAPFNRGTETRLPLAFAAGRLAFAGPDRIRE
ncbi:hypothetical protein FB451DRAFT_1452763 [Mycena latifolia]|nr:hypothetical protein FB451DRAFT_1452763 [Mycena latifolia]